MRRLKKKIFLGSFGMAVAVLGVIRWICPQVALPRVEADSQTDCPVMTDSTARPALVERKDTVAVQKPVGRVYNRIFSVPSYDACFPDVQEVQIVAAQRWGVPPIANRQEAEARKEELVYVGACPFYDIDNGMSQSIPYLVPRASVLLRHIGRTFMDSLDVKGVPLYRIIVSSVLRTEEDVSRLRKRNLNASEQSCHRYGTTFDIAYNRYNVVSNPDGPMRRAVRDDTLKWVLSEVLRDCRAEGRCYVKYERKQGCFHITVR